MKRFNCFDTLVLFFFAVSIALTSVSIVRCSWEMAQEVDVNDRLSYGIGKMFFGGLSVASFAIKGLLANNPELASKFNKIGQVAALPYLVGFVPDVIRSVSKKIDKYPLLSKPLDKVANILEFLNVKTTIYVFGTLFVLPWAVYQEYKAKKK